MFLLCVFVLLNGYKIQIPLYNNIIGSKDINKRKGKHKNIITIIIPEGVTSIGKNAFSGCGSLVTITIPNSVTRIGRRAFRGCTSLATVTITDSVTSISGGAFLGCSSLKTISILNSVIIIGNGAFNGCKSLENITIPRTTLMLSFNSIKTLITTVVLTSDCTSIGMNAFDDCSSLATVTIPNSVTSIGNGAFSGCSSLVTLTIPDSVTSIGQYAFSGCRSLVTVTIPDSVTSIGKYAFYDCSAMTTLFVQHTTSKHDVEQSVSRIFNTIPLVQITRIWAPDHIINQLTGPFKYYTTLVEVPRELRAAPNATTWSGVQLWKWWSDPQQDAFDRRVLDRKRQQMVWTIMHVALRLETTSTSPELADVLPPEMWMLIMTFVKNE